MGTNRTLNDIEGVIPTLHAILLQHWSYHVHGEASVLAHSRYYSAL